MTQNVASDEPLTWGVVANVSRDARDSVGKTVAELEAQNIRRDRLRFVRGEYQPRRMDGVVHAWLDDDERVARTQFG